MSILLACLFACTGAQDDPAPEPVPPAHTLQPAATTPVQPIPGPTATEPEPAPPDPVAVPAPAQPVAAPAPAQPVAAPAPAQPVAAPDLPAPVDAPVLPPPVPEVLLPVDFVLQPRGSSLQVAVFNDSSTLGGGLGHDHAIAASTFDGTVHFDPSDPNTCRIEVSFPVSALEVDPSGSRQRSGLEGEGASSGDKKKIKQNFSGRKQLDSDSHPTIRFAADTCEAKGNDRYRVRGTLTIRGVAASIAPTVRIQVDADGLTATTRFHASASDFGFKPFSALAGTLRNLDRMQFDASFKGAPTL